MPGSSGRWGARELLRGLRQRHADHIGGLSDVVRISRLVRNHRSLPGSNLIHNFVDALRSSALALVRERGPSFRVDGDDGRSFVAPPVQASGPSVGVG